MRFSDIKVGDQLVHEYAVKSQTLGPDGWSEMRPSHKQTNYCIVTDLWFDPVRGQKSYAAGQMAAVSWIRPDGSVDKRKRGHSLRGLASNGYRYAEIDYINLCKARISSEKVVGIGFGNVIRRRPKVAHSTF